MAGMFGKASPPPEAPKPVRMPNITDPSVVKAGERTRQAALTRQGRLSTILTDQTKAVSGSPGQKLGA